MYKFAHYRWRLRKDGSKPEILVALFKRRDTAEAFQRVCGDGIIREI